MARWQDEVPPSGSVREGGRIPLSPPTSIFCFHVVTGALTAVSFVSERDGRIDRRRPARGNQRGGGRDDREHDGDDRERVRIAGLDAEQQTREQARQAVRQSQSD